MCDAITFICFFWYSGGASIEIASYPSRCRTFLIRSHYAKWSIFHGPRLVSPHLLSSNLIRDLENIRSESAWWSSQPSYILQIRRTYECQLCVSRHLMCFSFVLTRITFGYGMLLLDFVGMKGRGMYKCNVFMPLQSIFI